MNSLTKTVVDKTVGEEAGLNVDEDLLGSMEKWKRAANTPFQSDDHFNKEI